MRILFLNPFPQSTITGGIKKFYRCAEILAEEGLDAWIWQPGGPPAWLSTRARVLSGGALDPAPEDLLILPEVLDGFLATLAKDPRFPRKVLFCQNQYNLLNRYATGQRVADLGFSAVFCPSSICAGFVSRVFHEDRVHVVPSSVDPALFRPAAKRLQIACAPRKLREEIELVRAILVTKHPGSAGLPWVPVDRLGEAEVARTLGESAIYFSTSHRESLGILPLEAMSAGCAVVGFHGYGGLEYATPENGRWFSPDELEETADGLWEAALAFRDGSADHEARVQAGYETARRFRPEDTRRALLAAVASVLADLGGPAPGLRTHRISASGLVDGSAAQERLPVP